ncbi:tetratricopeptide repeat protein [Ramlibacter henchirensis]|uniref:Tetratricopeptide repeat protein n=1 Tax=Ramlibacter henchirensis TaxID=204072 RepID=A0A4Z0C5X6_9BURK|nr:tetratricopeptide repeat protein [Ramlibacter henchirensis]TFZ05748.1 tetratricopeptide repeat protein [Ramlibacter henchirensis]
MKLVLSALALSLAAALSAHAADTPTVATPTAAERLANARKAIDSKDWSRAMRELNAAARDEPRNPDVHNLLGYSYRKRANPDLPKAMEHYRTALRLDPAHKGAHEYIGEAYLMERRPDEAEKHLAELQKICGGTSCEEYQDLAKAIAEYKAKN